MKLIYVGCRTSPERGGHGKGIAIFHVGEAGDWQPFQTCETLPNPSYLCMDRHEDFLYTVHGDRSEISAFRIENNGALSYLNTVCSGGTNPVHLTVSHDNRWIFVANLQTGCVAVHARQHDGRLLPAHGLYFIAGNGGPGHISHPHQVTLDQSGRFLIVSAQGRTQGVGQVTVFELDSENGTLKNVCAVKARAIAEPRHGVVSPDNHFFYGVNEKDYTVTEYSFDAQTGQISPRRILQTLPEDYVSDGWASGIALDSQGRYLYISDRKRDCVTVFSIDAQYGSLTRVGESSSYGKQPRFISVSADDTELIVANELSDNIVCLPIAPSSGLLGHPAKIIGTGSPVCVVEKIF